MRAIASAALVFLAVGCAHAAEPVAVSLRAPQAPDREQQLLLQLSVTTPPETAIVVRTRAGRDLGTLSPFPNQGGPASLSLVIPPDALRGERLDIDITGRSIDGGTRPVTVESATLRVTPARAL